MTHTQACNLPTNHVGHCTSLPSARGGLVITGYANPDGSGVGNWAKTDEPVVSEPAVNEAERAARLSILRRLVHERWCDYETDGCRCEAGQALIDLIAIERRNTVERIRAQGVVWGTKDGREFRIPVAILDEVAGSADPLSGVSGARNVGPAS